MEFQKLTNPDLQIVKPKIFADQRGYFFEVFQQEVFRANHIDANFVQFNQSGSKKGVLRGLHYQVNKSQGKLVRVLNGEIFDVAIDLRRQSPSFGLWEGVYLNDVEKYQLWIPPGFAHGFLVMSEWADVQYSTTDYYSPLDERTILWNDPQLGILWPLEIGQNPSISEKDSQGLPFTEAEKFE